MVYSSGVYQLNTCRNSSTTYIAPVTSGDTSIDLNSDWKCHYMSSKVSNKDLLKDITPDVDKNSELQQTGVTGIVMVPDADKSFDFNKGTYTYSDLLIQGIIDCNFKFNLRK